uniref:Uncharacterized protein n=1 Tax=Anguilla anguilla TaxID=7936 RepID=A0A0E9R459_ANGAN
MYRFRIHFPTKPRCELRGIMNIKL